ncbi:MAG: SMP-30/gluconolactonase/LRE family protein [Prevotellaceae bacterium]|jgi:gluconolactonase|nr:SMP-30/gluconolactonase/LRE family protein [Prevotellaceae bacterium]
MKKLRLTAILLFVPFMIQAQNSPELVADGAKVEKLAEGFGFTEGPTADSKGNVYFTDQPNDKIWKWSIDGKLSVALDKTGRANGLYFDRNGRLLACSDENNELWSIDLTGKQHETLINEVEGKQLNGPNDLWVHPNGGVYFTDPLYRRQYWTNRNAAKQMDGRYVYFLSPDRKKIEKVAIDLKQPNGIIGTPDGKHLYVADIDDNKTYIYDIEKDGSLKNKKLFAPLGSDGMTIDKKGNIYLTGKGVTVFNTSGKQILHIDVEANWTANVCFGGKNMQTLFITASQYLYALKMNVKGVRPHNPK